MTAESAESARPLHRRAEVLAGLVVASGWIVCICLCLFVEISRLRQAIRSPAGGFGWFADWNAETTLPLVVLGALPGLSYVARRMRWSGVRRATVAAEGIGVSGPSSRPVPPRSSPRFRWTNEPLVRASALTMWSSCLLLFLMSIGCSAVVGNRQFTVQGMAGASQKRLTDLPPAYHDEFSYLLQARTFLSGRLSWPGMNVRPDLFHQVHVLNQPATASRYCPWTGAWMAPFEAMGHPLWGHWTAGGVSCVFGYLTLVQLTRQRWALLGGLLLALSPGIAVFSSLLLAHHPTMMALSIFHWAFLRMMLCRRPMFALIAGPGLSLAMLGRPMTAAGAALPYGVWMVLDWSRSVFRTRSSPGVNWRHVLAMGVPLFAGFVVLAVINQAVMGTWSRSAYQHYTETMTPRHRSGFNNVVNSRPVSEGPYVLRAYDTWAVNLTPALALRNVGSRISASVQWSLGVIPILLGITMAVALCLTRTADFRVKWLWMSLLSLHLVHVPYWYDGILHWHYVFESAPLLLMLTAIGLGRTAETLEPLIGTRVSRAWVLTLCGLVLLPGWIDADELWGPSKVSMAVGEQAYSRIRMEQFRQLTRSSRVLRPAIILVDETATDPQLSFIINPPDLVDDVLVCRRPAHDFELSELHQAFPDRTMYLFDPGTFRLSGLRESPDPDQSLLRRTGEIVNPERRTGSSNR